MMHKYNLNNISIFVHYSNGKKLKQKVLKVLKSVLKQAVCLCCGVTHACANPVQAQDKSVIISALFERERSTTRVRLSARL